MFSPAEVDELFASTTRALQRSQVLLDERRGTTLSSSALPPVFCQPVTSAASTAVGSAASAAHGSSSNSTGGTAGTAGAGGASASFAETVRSLRSLGDFRAFVEATTAMQAKVVGELRAPSAAVRQRRRRGVDFALLQSVVRGVRAATAAAGWRAAEATAALWAGEAAADVEGSSSSGHGSGEESGGTGGAGTLSASSTSSAGGAASCGSHITATLLFAAFCVDVAVCTPRAAPAIAADLRRIFAGSAPVQSEGQTTSSTGEDAAAGTPDSAVVDSVAEWSNEGDAQLRKLLEEVAAMLPKSVAGHFMGRAAHLLFHPLPLPGHLRRSADSAPLPQHLGCAVLSGGPFLFPGFDSHLLERYPSTLAVRWFLRPLQVAAQNLRLDYYRSAAAFAAQCRWMLGLVFVLTRACQRAAEDERGASVSAAEAQAPIGRHVRLMQRVYDAWLMPLEKTFGHDAARHGMSVLFYTHLVLPHAQLTHSRHLDARTAWSSLLQTAQYRLLMVLDRLAQSEVAQAHGTSTTAAKQRTYESLLRQKGGKVSVSLLQTLAEDKQLVLEETPSRSPDGHRLYRLHDGMDDGGSAAKAVFVYVDDGALFMKVGRSRVFQRVKSVEDIFRPLQ